MDERLANVGEFTERAQKRSRLHEIGAGAYDVKGDATLTHEWAKDTAYQIYYGPGQMYWKPGVALTPLPYP